MDKYDYKLKTEQMLELMEDGAYRQAAEIADTIDWKRVRNTGMLANVSEIARAMGVKGVAEMSAEEYRKAAVDAVQQLSIDVGIPTKLEAIKEEDLQFLAESAHADACAPGNPKDASVEDLKDLFRKIM